MQAVTSSPSQEFTYSANIRNLTPAATATDVVTIAGATGKKIKVLSLEISGVQTAAGVNEWFLIKRSALDTGGTPVAMPAVPLDSQNPTAAATVQNFTANPGGLGTAVGTITAPRVAFGTTANTTNPVYLFDYNDTNGSPIVLRSAAEQLALNFNGAAIPAGMAINVTVKWIEQN